LLGFFVVVIVDLSNATCAGGTELHQKRCTTFGTTAIALLTATAAIAIGATIRPASASAPVSFTYWTSFFKPQWITTIDNSFDKTHPGYQVHGQYISTADEYLPKLIAALKSGTYPTVDIDQSPSDLPLVQASGKLIPLNGDMTALTNQLYPGIKAALFYRGKQLGMALSGVGDIVLFYNRADFKAAGISSPPKTWPELAKDAVKLTDPKAKRWGFYVPTGDAEWISYDWEPVLWGDGGKLLNANQTKATFDSTAGIKALSTWVNLVRKYKAAPAASYAADGNFDGPTAFSSNAVAMITDGQWLEGEIPKSVDYGVAPYPAGTKGPSTNLGIEAMALLKTTRAEDKAGLAFIKFLASPKEGAYIAYESEGLPDSPAQLSQPLLKADESKKFYSVYSEMERYGQVRPITPDYNAVSQDLWTEINAAIEGRVTPARALSIASEEADRALAENK
jgi:multiple sugar transport system substrate-binding protein